MQKGHAVAHSLSGRLESSFLIGCRRRRHHLANDQLLEQKAILFMQARQMVAIPLHEKIHSSKLYLR